MGRMDCCHHNKYPEWPSNDFKIRGIIWGISASINIKWCIETPLSTLKSQKSPFFNTITSPETIHLPIILSVQDYDIQ